MPPIQPGDAQGAAGSPNSRCPGGQHRGIVPEEKQMHPSITFLQHPGFAFLFVGCLGPPTDLGLPHFGGEQGLCVPAPPLAAWFSASVPAEEGLRAGTPPGLGSVGCWVLDMGAPRVFPSDPHVCKISALLANGALWGRRESGGKGGRDGEIGAGGVCVKWERNEGKWGK